MDELLGVCTRVTDRLVGEGHGHWKADRGKATLIFFPHIHVSIGLSALQVKPLGPSEPQELVADRLIDMYETLRDFCEDKITAINKENG